MKGVFQAKNEVAHVSGHDGIDHGGWLVIQNRFGVLRQRACDSYRTPVPGGKLAGQFVQDLIHFQQVRQLIDVGIDVVGGQAGLLFHRKRDIVRDRQRIEQCAGLEHHGDLAPNFFKLLFREVRDVLAVNENSAGIRFQETHDVF